MFGWLRRRKRGLYGSNYQHIAHRSDWDVLNRELFYEVIDKWPTNALALITNVRNHESTLDKPYVQMRTDRDPDIRALIGRMNNEQFNKIFELARTYRPERTDCYRLKNLGLPNNSLAFLVEHEGGDYRTILLFGGARVKGELEKRLEHAGRIISAKPRGRTADEAQAGRDAVANATAPFANDSAIREAAENALLAREEHLQPHVAQLEYRERVELAKIQQELKRRKHG